MQEWAFAAHEVAIDPSPNVAPMPGYGVSIAPGGEYNLYTDNHKDSMYGDGDSVQKTVTLDNNLVIYSLENLSSGSSVAGPVSINFMPPDPTTNIVDGTGTQLNSVVVVFKIANTNTTKRVVINKAGLIYVK